jgi:methyl-accepting chemotaxis protein
VGSLAEMSGHAAKEIEKIVKESVETAELITSDNKTRVEAGNEHVISTAKILKDIIEAASKMFESSLQVLNASKDQANGIEQINMATGQLDKAIQGTASSAEETASMSEELNAQTESLNNIVGNLSDVIMGKQNRSSHKSNIKESNILNYSKIKKSEEGTTFSNPDDSEDLWTAV